MGEWASGDDHRSPIGLYGKKLTVRFLMDLFWITSAEIAHVSIQIISARLASDKTTISGRLCGPCLLGAASLTHLISVPRPAAPKQEAIDL